MRGGGDSFTLVMNWAQKAQTPAGRRSPAFSTPSGDLGGLQPAGRTFAQLSSVLGCRKTFRCGPYHKVLNVLWNFFIP